MTMNITNAQFTATGSITALVDGVQMSIPADPGNRHYAAMLDQGITPEPHPVPTPADVLATAKAEAHAALLGWINNFMEQFTGGVPAAEIASWATKADRARAYQTGTPSAMIDAEAAARGIAGPQMAAQIVARADAYEVVIGTSAGLRSSAQDGIDAATTPEAVAAVLQAALDAAEAAMEAMGVVP